MSANDNSFTDELVENPIIAAVRNEADLNAALNTNNRIIFVLYGDLTTIKDISGRLKTADKIFFIHLDMIEGLKSDEAGLRFIKNYSDPYGIITTKHTLIRPAKSLSLCTILRWFVIDSKSYQSGIKNAEETRPHAVEVLPGVSKKIIKTCSLGLKSIVIAGGLIETKEEVVNSLKAGAVAISTSCRGLWELN